VVYLDTGRAVIRRRDRSNLRAAWKHLGVVPRNGLADALRAVNATGSLSVVLGSSLCRFETLREASSIWRAADLAALARSRIQERIREDASSLRVATEAIWDSTALACAIGAGVYADIESTATSCGLTLTSVRPWIGELFVAIAREIKGAHAVAVHEADSVTLAIEQDGAPSIQTLPARDEASSNECLRLLLTGSSVAASSFRRFRLNLDTQHENARMRHSFADLVFAVDT
jgi:hypothetical protein